MPVNGLQRQSRQHARTVRPRLSREDALFTELDHRRVGNGPDSWIVEIYGIHVEKNQAWIQIAPSTDASSSVLLHIPASCSAHHALAALEAWAEEPRETRSRVIEVMRVA
jgi:hypothetical protein